MTTDSLDGLEQLRRIIDEQPEPAPESVMLGLDYCYAEWVAERARHAEEVAALRGQLGRFERARHDLDRLVQYVLENEDVENPSDVAALMSAGIVEHLLAVLNQEAPGD